MSNDLPPAMPGRPSELEGPIGALAEALGGIGPLAEAVGVSVRTIQRYHSGDVVPPTPVKKMLALLAVQHNTKVPFPLG